MLNRNKPTKMQMPEQSRPPGFEDIQFLLQQAQANLGRPVELPFSAGSSSHTLTVQCHKPKEEAQWMFYSVNDSSSKLEWSIVSNDVNMIHNAMCAQFPEVDLNLNVAKGAMAGPTSLSLDTVVAAEPPAVHQVSQPAQGKALMEGDLKTLQIANLLQSISMAKMTGRLEILGDSDKAQVYFSDGNLVQCTMLGVTGENAALELCGWQTGVYRFYHEHPPESQPINKRLDQILMEGATLFDQQKYLDQQGVNPESVFSRVNPGLTEQAFEQIVSKGPPALLNFQKMMYRAADDRSTLLEILRRYPLPKRDWVPVLFSLINCQLIKFRQGAPRVEEKQALEVSEIDWTAVRYAEKNLFRAETDLLSYPAFLGFLEREQARFEILKRPYSLVVMRLDRRNEQGLVETLPLKGVKDIAKRIENLKRKCDIIGHFQTFGLALLLPETTGDQARNFARTLSDVLQSESIADAPRGLVVGFGLATIPEDCDRLEALLAYAQPRV